MLLHWLNFLVGVVCGMAYALWVGPRYRAWSDERARARWEANRGDDHV